MDEFRLVRGFSTLDAAAAAVNALVQGGIEHGATSLRAAGGVYLVIVEPASAEEHAFAERLLAGHLRAARSPGGSAGRPPWQ
jgi:hypothetical protein